MIRSMRLLHSLSILVLLAPAAASAEGIQIESREYKLMLDPDKFAGNQPEKSVDRLWERLQGVIDRHIGLDNGKSRAEKSFKSGKERIIQFRDTETCVLERSDYALRERVTVKSGEEDKSSRELTLKFRTPDVFLAAATDLTASSDNASTKLEEDIAPLMVRTKDSAGKVIVTLAEPPSMRSLFSVSTKIKNVDPDAPFNVLGDVTDAYPTLPDNLKKAGIAALPPKTKLVTGSKIRELTFEGAEVDLGPGTDGEFTLTLWYPQSAASLPAPLIAEISFKYDTVDGGVKSAVARRALQLFEAMQAHLGDWSNPKQATKTSLALPTPCQ